MSKIILRLTGFSIAVLVLVSQAVGQSVTERGPDHAEHGKAVVTQPRILQIPYVEQEGFLNSLLPRHKHLVVLDARLLYNGLRPDDRGTVCTGGAGGSITGGNGVTEYFRSSFQSVCQEVRGVRGTVVLGVKDDDWPRTAHLILMECESGYSKSEKAVGVASFGLGLALAHRHECFVQEGPDQRVVLARGKHDTWNVDVGARAALGSKVQVAEFRVVEVQLVRFLYTASSNVRADGQR